MGRAMEVVELVDDSAGVRAKMVGVDGTGGAGRGKDNIVAEAV